MSGRVEATLTLRQAFGIQLICAIGDHKQYNRHNPQGTEFNGVQSAHRGRDQRSPASRPPPIER